MDKRILVVGGGAREHAICWKLAQSPTVAQLFAAPGNPGIAEHAELLPIAQTDIPALVAAAREHNVDLVVIGPEAPLELGLADELRAADIPTFGPSRTAAQIETSKSWAKELMDRTHVPTAHYVTAEDLFSALAALQDFTYPCVIKADGLAAGKGVVVVPDYEEAVLAVTALVDERSLGDAGARIVIEELLTGPEVSIFAITDGATIHTLPPACDHKRAYDGDHGPNTGGMGAYAPTSLVDPEMVRRIERTIIAPILNGMRDQGTPFAGVLYAGLMLTADGPKVIEFNARFGDPEAQVVLPLIESDFADLLYAAATGTLADTELVLNTESRMVGVVVAAGGYPGPFERYIPITGTDAASSEAIVFQAGTSTAADGALISNGGRILTVVGSGTTMADAQLHAYAAVEQIEIPGSFYRTDIGHREPN